MAGRREMTDKQWELLEAVLRPSRLKDNRGRSWIETRDVLNGVLWVLGTGAWWAEMPKKYPSYQTSHRRFQAWVRDGKLVEALQLPARQLCELKSPSVRAILNSRGVRVCPINVLRLKLLLLPRWGAS